MSDQPKFLIVGFDGFRPDMMNADATPNLWRLARSGVQFAHHRAVFPSESYVNIASIITGAAPTHHGIVANEFLDPVISRTTPWAGHCADLVEAGMRAYDGRLHSVLTLGEVLGAAGMRHWVFSGNSAGSALLKHAMASRYPGHFCFVVREWQRSHPIRQAHAVVDRHGELPGGVAGAENEWLARYMTDVFLDLEAREGMPEVAILWFSEPDHAFHGYGLGAPEARDGIAAVDRQLGRLIEWRDAHAESGRINLVVTSDHGHITQMTRVDTTMLLSKAGFKVARHLEDGADLALTPGYSGNIRVRDGDRGLLSAVCTALMDSPWIGQLFTAGAGEHEGVVPGTFARSLVLADHPRSPDVFFVLRATDDLDPFGFTGTCFFDNDLGVGKGYHGGLHPSEMSALLVAAGSAFRSGHTSIVPSSVTDIMPTLLMALGLPAAGCSGRCLTEALTDADDWADRSSRRWSVGHGRYRQALDISYVGGKTYIDGGQRLA